MPTLDTFTALNGTSAISTLAPLDIIIRGGTAQ